MKIKIVQKSEATATWTRDKHIFNSEETTGQSILWRTLYIFPFLFMIIMSSVLIHSWVFLSDKSQIVNMPSLRKNINTVCTYGFSVSANWWRFVCYKFQQQQSSKTISTLWKQGKYENIDFVTCFTYYCGVWCEPHTVHHCTEEPATTPATGEGLAWGDAAQNMVPSYTTLWTLGQLHFSLSSSGHFMWFLNTGERRRSKNLTDNFLMTIQLLWHLNFLHSFEVWTLNMKITLQYYNNNKHTYL